MPEDRAAEFMWAGVAPLCGIEEALAAAEAAAFVGRRWKEPLPQPVIDPPPSLATREGDHAPGCGLHPARGQAEHGGGGGSSSAVRDSPPPPPFGRSPSPAGAGEDQPAGASSGRTIFEAEAKAALAEFGLPVPAGRVVTDTEEAVAAAEAIGYPVAVKALGIAHKSEAGAVRLRLANAEQVRAAADALGKIGSGLLVEEMIVDGVAELLVGVTRDPQFGLLMTIAAGGVLVELLGDSASLLLPASEDDIRAAILALKTAPLLQGFRGRPVGDLEAAVSAAAAIARFAEAHADEIEELDVNPLVVRPQGQGAVAVDALIRMRDA
jgi:acyl-CoA synthetase (NDP forming)